ncbi:MAG: radical SAM protein [Candidatus Omnitrophica bacterium]|nr:radical SAM protein [Candidatus Omnitrophota bacterium]
MKIVIANSIGVDSRGYYIIHSPSRWSEGIKNKDSWFAYYPWELAYCSSLLKKYTDHEVKLVDGCLERLSYKAYLEKIKRESPDWLIMESATRMIDENLRLANELKKESGARIVFVGHHASAFPEYLLKNRVDFVCVGEYEYTALELIQGKDPEFIPGLYPNKRRPLLDINSLPWPEDEDVSRLNYGMPGEPSSEYLEIQMYASRGCRRSCDFCVAGNVYYAQPNWRQRQIDDIISELKYLRNKYPKMEGVFFDEEEHNASKDFILKLTDTIVNAGLNDLHYEAMCDVRSLDKETMKAMHKAGYYKVRIGIETTSLEVLCNNRKPLDINRIGKTLEEAKEIGLKTYGTFMIGMPGSSRDADLNTVKYIEKMILVGLLDNVQISICTPQPGTPFYEQVNNKGYLISRDFMDYDGGRRAVVSYPGYSNNSIESVMAFAFRSREHASFLRKLRERKILSWAVRTYRKYGFLAATLKLLKRLRLELLHFLPRKTQKKNPQGTSLSI